MRSTLRHRSSGQWSGALALWALLVMACWPAQGAIQDALQIREGISIDRARLSVNLEQADIRAVLTEIAEKAGIAMTLESVDQRGISAQFTDVELEAGLRRLLQLASLNYTMLYTRGEAGTPVIKEVHVFGRMQHGEPLQPTVARSDGTTGMEQQNLSDVSPAPQAPQASPPPSEIIQRLQEFSKQLSQGTQGETPPAHEAKDLEALRSLLKGFEKQSE